MDEIAKMLIATSPVAAVMLLLGVQALQIWKDDLKEANAKRDKIMLRLDAIEKKLEISPLPITTE